MQGSSPDPMAIAPRWSSRLPDRLFRGTSGLAAWTMVVVLAGLAVMLTAQSLLAFDTFGVVGFVTGNVWDPVQSIYGALPYIVGTLLSSFLALVLATPIAILTAIYLGELAPPRIAVPLTLTIELIAAIPSVVIGLWGVFVLSPFLKATIESWIVSNLGFVPIFGGPPLGIGLFAAGVILAIMILPTIVAISREVIRSVPDEQREAMLGLGATRWETTWKVVLPIARPGIIGAVILGLGRALGETMAVTMVIGNSPDLPDSVFDQSQTIASKIATTFNEASVGLQTSSLIALGLILLVITVLLNIAARALVRRTSTLAEGR